MITRWAGSDTGSWFEWSSILHQLWHYSLWSDYFYIANTTFPDTSQPLHAHFQQLTATACSACDPQANHPFETDSALCRHMLRQHQRHLCRLCLRVCACLPRLSCPVLRSLCLCLMPACCVHHVWRCSTYASIASACHTATAPVALVYAQC